MSPSRQEDEASFKRAAVRPPAGSSLGRLQRDVQLTGPLAVGELGGALQMVVEEMAMQLCTYGWMPGRRWQQPLDEIV
jgi:hypothetical protein